MKRILGAILVIVSLLNVSLTVSANDASMDSITLQGIEISVDDFVEEYISTEVTSINLNEYARCDLELFNIIIDDDEIEMDANMTLMML